ncbi:MAG: hypothetical protein HDQ91_06550 [Desulfovibrio sp.]|nr:hypothetical protein [Desulfovibrio sp.]
MNSYKQSLYSGIARVMANLLMVGAIFLAMHQARRWPGWSSETVFCLIFFGITIPLWLGTWSLIKWIRRRWPTPPVSIVDLPGLGPQPVRWKVREHRPGLSPAPNS